jgi:HPt (histidine-containing phosphotransfer) domain-containing protein
VASLPVIALTAHRFVEVSPKVFGAGFTALLTKPIRGETLIAALSGYGHSFTLPPERVRVDEFLKDVIPAYLEKRRADVATYREAIARADFVAIRNLAHKTKGSGAGYGFPRFTELGAAIEEAAMACDAVSVGGYIEAFALYAGGVEWDWQGREE